MMNIIGKNPWPDLRDEPLLVAPSLLSCDFARAGEQIDAVLAAGADVLHVDVMDGRFVPNLSMGPGFVKSIRRHTPAVLDVHIMVSDPGYYIERFAEAGADSITFHVEAANCEPNPRKPEELLARLKELSIGAGISVKPGTPIDAISEEAIELADIILVMTVEPGFGGQKFMPDMMDKISNLRKIFGQSKRIEIDGGINPQTARICREKGADVLVAGANVFDTHLRTAEGERDFAQAIAALRK